MNPARTVLKEVPKYLNDHGVLLLGLDAAFVSDLAMTKLIEDSKELELQKIIRSWISSSEVFVIGPRRYVH